MEMKINGTCFGFNCALKALQEYGCITNAKWCKDGVATKWIALRRYQNGKKKPFFVLCQDGKEYMYAFTTDDIFDDSWCTIGPEFESRSLDALYRGEEVSSFYFDDRVLFLDTSVPEESAKKWMKKYKKHTFLKIEDNEVLYCTYSKNWEPIKPHINHRNLDDYRKLNKYGFTYANISSVEVLDWSKLKNNTWKNEAMSKTEGIWCHLEGCNFNPKYDDEDEFWIGFYESGKVEFRFTCYSGMAKYIFDEFFSEDSVANIFDLGVQINTIKYLTKLVDDGIISKPR